MAKLVKLVQSPTGPALAVVDDIVMHLHVPYSDHHVTILINPTVSEFQERPLENANVKIRNLTVLEGNADSKVLEFDFSANSVHTIRQGDKNYDIRLMRIGKEPFEGQNFHSYEFFVSESSVYQFTLEGNIVGWLKHKDKDWATNNKNYTFSPRSTHGITLSVSKTSGRSLKFNLVGPLKNEFGFVTPVPDIIDERGIFFAMTWNTKEICLYVNAQLIAKTDAPRVPPDQ